VGQLCGVLTALSAVSGTLTLKELQELESRQHVAGLILLYTKVSIRTCRSGAFWIGIKTYRASLRMYVLHLPHRDKTTEIKNINSKLLSSRQIGQYEYVKTQNFTLTLDKKLILKLIFL